MSASEPAIADIDRCIDTIEKSEKRWSGNAGYRRFLETELFCLREVKARLERMDSLAQDKRASDAPPLGPFVKALKWEEVYAHREDGGKDVIGWEADSGFETYYGVDEYFASDSYGWEVCFGSERIGDVDDPVEARNIAQRHYADKIRAALEPTGLRTPAEGEPVICSGCGSTWTDEQLRAEKAKNPKLLSCCPERKPLNIREWMTRAEEYRRVEHESWNALEGHGFTPEAGNYLPDAIDNAISCMATAREDLIKQRDQALAQVENAAARDVLAERQRQKEKEGWTIEHDDSHISAEMAMAAAVYALTSFLDTEHSRETAFTRYWPWDRKWFKPAGGRKDLVRAGALILAEIERLDRREHSSTVRSPEVKS